MCGGLETDIKLLSTSILFDYMSLFVYVGITYVSDSLEELAFFPPCRNDQIKIQVIKLESSCLYLLKHLAGPPVLHLTVETGSLAEVTNLARLVGSRARSLFSTVPTQGHSCHRLLLGAGALNSGPPVCGVGTLPTGSPSPGTPLSMS